MSDTPGICIHEEAGWQPPDPLRAELLAKRVAPFILRRRKSDVAK